MEYNVLSRVETYAADGESLEEYFHVKALELSDTVLKESAAQGTSSSSATPAGSTPSEVSTEDDDERNRALSADLAEEPPSSAPDNSAPESTYATSLALRERQYPNVFACALINLLKGFGIGCSARTAVGLISVLISLARMKPKDRTRAGGIGGLILSALGKLKQEALQVGAALGTMCAVHNSIIFKERERAGGPWHYSTSRAAAIAALGLSWAPRELRQTISLMASVRAAEIALRHMVDKCQVPRVPHAVEAVMCAMSAHIMHCWLFAPHLLERSYLTFLNRTCGKAVELVQGVGAVTTRTMSPAMASAISAARVRTRLPPLPALGPGAAGPPSASAVAAAYSLGDVMYAPGEGAVGHFLRYTWHQFRKIVWIYLPVHAIPLVLFKLKSLLADPVTALRQLVGGVVRSTAFLATFCSLGWLGFAAAIPLIHRTAPPLPHPPSAPPCPPPDWAVQLGARAAGALCGTSIFFEKPSRRIELVLYSALQVQRALISRLLRGTKESCSIARYVKAGEVALFSASMAVIMHACARHPSTVRSSYYRLLLRFFDPDRVHQALIARQKSATGGEQTTPAKYSTR